MMGEYHRGMELGVVLIALLGSKCCYSHSWGTEAIVGNSEVFVLINNTWSRLSVGSRTTNDPDSCDVCVKPTTASKLRCRCAFCGFVNLTMLSIATLGVVFFSLAGVLAGGWHVFGVLSLARTTSAMLGNSRHLVSENTTPLHHIRLFPKI